MVIWRHARTLEVNVPMSTATYRVTNETRAALAAFADDLIDVAAQGNAPMPEQVADQIEQVISDGYYKPAARDDDGRVVGEDA